VAFPLEAIDPDRDRRLIEIVFLMQVDRHARPRRREPDREPCFVPIDATADLALWPPIAGYLRGLSRTRLQATAPYLGNLWRANPGQDGQDVQPLQG
jgi:hypothetical protein